jgi:hypothetical protein
MRRSGTRAGAYLARMMRITLMDVSEPVTALQGRLAGVWRSCYTYTSSSRDDQEFTGSTTCSSCSTKASFRSGRCRDRSPS